MSENDKQSSVCAPVFGQNANPSGALYELGSRTNIEGFVICCRLSNGNYERFVVKMNMGEEALASHFIQAGSLKRTNDNLGK